MMHASVFGPPSADLVPGARNAVEVCLGIQRGERVALIADRASGEVGATIAAVIDQVGALCDPVLIEDVTARPMTVAPAAVLHALDRADAGILCVQPEQGELGARMAIVAVVERRAIRYAHMVGVTPQIMKQGMRADYRLVDRLSQRLCERMPRARGLRVETAGGTELSATFDPMLTWVKTSGLINPRYWSNLPAGEVFTTPLSVDGVFVCDGTAGDYFGPKYGDLRASPLTLEIAGGRLQSAHSSRTDLQQEFW
ncbi:MAG: aminopeptidase, partial [Vicinamibacterales bacterium]